MAFASGVGLGEVFCDQRLAESRPRGEVAVAYGSKESRWRGAESASMEESCELAFRLCAADHAVGKVLLFCAGRGSCLGFWGERDVPKAVRCISLSFDNDLPVFDDVDVVFGEKGDAVVVTELSDGDEGPLEVIENMADLGCFGEGGCEGDSRAQ
jgi:hypothetical protein